MARASEVFLSSSPRKKWSEFLFEPLSCHFEASERSIDRPSAIALKQVLFLLSLRDCSSVR